MPSPGLLAPGGGGAALRVSRADNARRERTSFLMHTMLMMGLGEPLSHGWAIDDGRGSLLYLSGGVNDRICPCFVRGRNQWSWQRLSGWSL